MILHEGDMIEVLARLKAEGALFDACVTDPPYHLTSTVKRFGKAGSAPAQFGTDGAFARASRGFMGKEWDGGDIAFRPDTWRAVYNVLKPGAHLVAFGGTRTVHRIACAVEDAGFEIRDSLVWLYGTGFPKSHNAGNGWGTALKPAMEPIILARKPLIGTVAANVEAFGTGAINIDGCRVGTEKRVNPPAATKGNVRIFEGAGRVDALPTISIGRWPPNVLHDGSDEVIAMFPQSKGQLVDVSHTAPSPKTSNVYGKMKRIGEATANKRYTHEGSTTFSALPGARRFDGGSAARFFPALDFDDAERCFYSSKANKTDRAGSKHPTVKPISLLRWLVRLVTPPGGVILDPFAGSGTLASAAAAEGKECVLIEREADYAQDIRARLASLQVAA